jgi:streptogramin lyase
MFARRGTFLLALVLVAAVADVRAQTVTEFRIGDDEIGGIAAGPDGNLWFTEPAANTIGLMTRSGSITRFSLPGSAPRKITAGADGNLWFTEHEAIGRITIDGAVRHFPLPVTGFLAEPVNLAAGPDGNIWYTLTISRVGRVTPTGDFLEFETGYNGVADITAGPDGNVWFTTAGAAESKICRITPDGAITQFGYYGELHDPSEIISGPDGNLWFTQSNSSLGRITPNGEITEFAIGAAVTGMSSWYDGNVWVTSGRTILVVTTSGKVAKSFALPPAAGSASGIARGPDGNLWFIAGSGTIGHLGFQRRRIVLH